MGEIADMVLEGVLCQQCGTFMDHETGHPQTCAGCAGEVNFRTSGRPSNKIGARWSDGSHLVSNWQNRAQAEVPAKVKVVCPNCGKRIKAVGFYQHMSDAHRETK